ncbi:formylmethanofuran dehydrogenase subunit C [Sphaerotilus hippei]|uniref:Formylmethanofuran dehydrogenase subunit C n=1 Tax=Sphaerotilus hippei TaxID=744406 RepID=A0A318GTV6_9BURK|nr:formylmethanofuran dehydrogenase subunit C [Sphaerotilus hippei]PXW91561.1 formylmethanofuran dehydrogenase subunit C [Sphaerotilus hippei]
MSSHRLMLRQRPALRLDLRGVRPATLATLSLAEIERLPLPCGRHFTPLAEWFTVERLGESEAAALIAAAGPADGPPPAGPLLALAGDLSQVDQVGWQLDGGTLTVDGPVGQGVGGAMQAGCLRVRGSAGALAGVEMSGGELHIEGDVGDYAAATLPGSMDGMRGGLLLVQGRAGDRFADRMRRGTAIVLGDAGDFFASRLVAGTLVLGGRCGRHPAHGLRRGSLVFASPEPAPGPVGPPTFVPVHGDAGVFWQLLARDLARIARTAGPPPGAAAAAALATLAGLPHRTPRRFVGDLSVDGQGELLFVA